MQKYYFDPAESNLFESCELQIDAITHIWNNPTWLYNYHSHNDFAEVIYIAGGKGTYTLDEIAYEVQENDLIVVNRGIIHAIASNPSDALHSWTLAVGGFQIRGLERDWIIPENAYPHFSAGDRGELFQQLFEQIRQQRIKREGHYNELAHQLARLMVMLAYQMAPTTYTRQSVPKSSFVMEIVDYIGKNYPESITLDSLSKMFHMSAGHISRTMTAEYGVSPINYLISRRMGEAQLMLISSNLSVTEVAKRVGYDNVYHFTKLFISRTGFHPSDFRKNYAKLGLKND